MQLRALLLLISSLLLEVSTSDEIPGCKHQVKIQPGDYCWKIANDNGLTVDELLKLNPGLNCEKLFPNQEICLKLDLQEIAVKSGDTCWEIANTNRISVNELKRFNPQLNCEQLGVGQKLLVPASASKGKNKENSNCVESKIVNPGDTCWSIATGNGLTLDKFYKLNPGINCDGLNAGKSVCIGEGSLPPAEITASPKPALITNEPKLCKSISVKSGDTCWAISTSVGLPLDELEKLNPSLDCSSLKPGSKICVGENQPSTSSCKSTQVQSGDTCWKIATTNDMTLQEFQELNPGMNCSHLVPGQKVCIGQVVKNCSSDNQIPSNCKTVYQSEANLTCATVETQFGLSHGELLQLNPDLAPSCCVADHFLPPEILLCVANTAGNPNQALPCTKYYNVKPGDTCWSIWVSHRLTKAEFFILNPNTDCDKLMPGAKICVSNANIQGDECQITRVVKNGETCQSIAQQTRLTLPALQNLNTKLDCSALEAGQILCLSNDPNFKQFENGDNQGPTKLMMESTVNAIMKDVSNLGDKTKEQFQNYLQGNVLAGAIVDDLSQVLATNQGRGVLEELQRSNKQFQDFDDVYNSQRPLLCEQLTESPYKTCICDFSTPFLHCQAKMMQEGSALLRRKRDISNLVREFQTRFKRAAKRGKGGKPNDNKNGGVTSNPLTGFLNSFCGGCLKSESACLDLDVCYPAFVVLEVCLGAGFCAPNPVSLVESKGHLTVTQFHDSRVSIDLSLCITVLNEILRTFGADACIAKGGTDYYYLKSQLLFEGKISLLVVRGIINGRVQVAEPFSEGVYDTESQKLLDDMCTEEKYQCDDYCQVGTGDVFLEWKVQGWFFGWRDIAKGSKNDPPPCKPKPKKITPPPESLNRIVLYTTSWAQYREFNATIDGELVTRPESCKKHAKTPKDIDPSLITHLNYAFLILDENTFELKNFEKNDDQLVAEMNGLKGKNPELKTLISIGGWSFCQGETSLGEGTKEIFSNMARTPEGRARFINSAINYVTSKNIDGIDIDWEFPLAGDREDFTALLREFRAAIDMSGKSLLLTFAAPAGRKFYSNIDLENIHGYVDFINLMTYDFHGGSFEAGQAPNVNAPIVDCSCPEIEDIELGLESYLAAGVPAGKINLGMATYGRTFTLDGPDSTLHKGSSEGSGKQGVCTLTPGVLSYYEIKEQIEKDGSEVKTDNALMSAYARFDTNQWVGYDNEETHGMKMCFARRKHLGGIMIWDGEMDDDLELVRKMKEKLQGANCDNFEIPDCPKTGRRKKRAAIRPKPTKKPPASGSRTQCTRPPTIKNRDAPAMKKCKGRKPGEKCRVVCKKGFKASQDDVMCRAGGVWSTDAECENSSPDCGKRPYPIIKVSESGSTGGTPLYIVKLDPGLKLPIWSMYVQKKFSGSKLERENGWKRHDCFTNSQLYPKQYTNTGFPKGHLSPQNAFSYSSIAMKTTNLMLNAAPQDDSTNSGPWKVLESKVKEFLSDYPGFVATGLCSSVKTIKRLPVPDCYWKMICTKTPKGTTTVGVYYHKNTKVGDLSARRKEIQKVHDQTFVQTLARGPGRNLADIWTSAASLVATVPGLPSPAACAGALTLSGGLNELWPNKDGSRGPGDSGSEDVEKFWNENIGSNKYGLKWDVSLPDNDLSQDVDENNDDEDDDDDEDVDEENEDGKADESGNIPSGRTRSRCGHEIKY